MNDEAGAALARLLAQFGASVIAEPDRLRGLLQDECPIAKREIAALMQAHDDGIPEDLQRVASGEPLEALASRLAHRLADHKALTREAADWAVRAWATALGIQVPNHSASTARNESAAAGAPADADERAKLEAQRRDDAGDRSTREAAARVATWRDRWTAWPSRTKRVAIGVVAAIAAVIGWNVLSGPELRITAVEMPESFLGDGKRREVFLEFAARGTTPRTVEIRYVRGDGRWNPPSWKVNLTGDATTSRRSGIGTMSYTTQQPAQVTFEYVLVAADGRRSEPFEKTFSIQPPPSTPPRITNLQLPGSVYVGREFTVQIAFEDPDGDVARVERRVIESSTPWAQDVYSQEAPGASGRKSGMTSYKFEAPKVPFKSVIEFVLIDARGSRSEPRRVAMEVLAAPSAPSNPATPGGAEGPRAQTPNSGGGGGGATSPPRNQCIPPSHLSARERWEWFQRNCLGIRR